jgi:flagellar protein FlaG
MIDIAKITPESTAARTAKAIEPARHAQQAGPELQRNQSSEMDRKRLEAQRLAEMEQHITREDAEEWIMAANNLLDTMNTHLKFTFHDKSDRWQVQLVNNSGEVLREFPPKEILEMAARIRDVMDKMAERHQAVGVLVDHKG